MAKDEMEKVFDECRSNEKAIQLVRGLMFWIVEPDESRTRKALVVLAEYAKEWAESEPPRLVSDLQPIFIQFCQSIIDAGPRSDGPDMPEPFTIGISIG